MSSIFGKNEKLNDQSLVNLGISLSYNLKMYFTLYGIYLGSNRSVVIREMLEAKRQKLENEDRLSENHLMECIADEAKIEWDNKDEPGGTFYPTYEKFTDVVREALEKRKLGKDYIEHIMNKIDRKISNDTK